MGVAPSALYAAPEAQIALPRDAVTAPVLVAASVASPCDQAREGRDSEDSETCSICLDTEPGLALPCGHLFHEQCLDRWLSQNPTCPNCGRNYGPRIGNMPDGEMRWYRSTARLAGHACGTIVLHFNFPPGMADGLRHAGRVQHAYLPDNAEGHQLLALFQLAFRRRVLFALGHSLTTGQYRPNFAIHLKTATCGGAAQHGFPDEDYYASALEELRAAGVQPEDAAAEAIDVSAGRTISSCRLTAVNLLTSVFVLCNVTCLACLVFALFTHKGKTVLLPWGGVTVALCWPFERRAVFFCVMMLLLILQDNEALIYSSHELPLASYVCSGACTYAFCGYLARGRCKRPFRVVAKQMRRLFRRSAFRKLMVLEALVMLNEPAFEPIIYVACFCLIGGLWQDVVLHRMRARSIGSSGAAEPLLAGVPQQSSRTVTQALEVAPRRTASRPTRPRPQDMTEADWGYFARCASLRGRPSAAQLHANLVTPEHVVERRNAGIAVREMMHNELVLGEDYFVFYHSYSASCILYELYTALAIRILDYPSDGPPVMRLDRRPFHNVQSLEALKALRAGHSSDHAPEFRRVAASAFVSWFATGGYRRSVLMSHFLRGYFGGHDIGDMTVLLEELLRSCGLPEVQLGRLVADVLALGERWGLEMSRYKDRGQPRVREETTCPGHVMQIFIHASIVDAVAYGSLPLGRPAANGVPISSWLARQCPLDGQARILLHPDLFLDSENGLVHIFTHSGSPIYGPDQRRELLKQLDALVAPIFAGSSPAACSARERARAGLGYAEGEGGDSAPSLDADDPV